MWIASTLGFFSIKQDTPKPNWFIRARVKADLEALKAEIPALAEVPVLDWKGADYRYRLIVEADQLTDVFKALQESIVYPNFKSAIGRSPAQRHKLAAYHSIWHTMADLQPTRPYSIGKAIAHSDPDG